VNPETYENARINNRKYKTKYEISVIKGFFLEYQPRKDSHLNIYKNISDNQQGEFEKDENSIYNLTCLASGTVPYL